MTKRELKKGIILKISNSHTVSVEIESIEKHERYKKVVFRRKRYLVHCRNPKMFKPGDTVTIMSVRPISKRKHWTLLSEQLTGSGQ